MCTSINRISTPIDWQAQVKKIVEQDANKPTNNDIDFGNYKLTSKEQNRLTLTTDDGTALVSLKVKQAQQQGSANVKMDLDVDYDFVKGDLRDQVRDKLKGVYDDLSTPSKALVVTTIGAAAYALGEDVDIPFDFMGKEIKGKIKTDLRNINSVGVSYGNFDLNYKNKDNAVSLSYNARF